MIDALYSVIVNWNLKEDTLICVDSLFAAGAEAGQIIVVDNGSSDGSTGALQERFGSLVRIISSEKNLGFAGGSNLGIQSALELGAKWILLLNNDAYVAPTFLAEMKNAITRNVELDIIGPVILFHDAPELIWFFGDRLIPGLLATISLQRRHYYHRQYPPFVPVDFLNGCCMLVKCDIFRKIGLFNPAYFMYGEEVDFCWRARMAGFRPVVATQAKVWHKISMSSNRDLPASRYLRIRNQIRFYRSYSSMVQLPLMFIFTFFRSVWIVLGDLVHGNLVLINPLIRGWLHGWFNQTGLTKQSE